MTWLQTIWNWKKANLQVAKLQAKITAAYEAGNDVLVAKLQRILVNSAAARAVAIFKTMTNKGGKTPGVDGKIISTPEQFWALMDWLKMTVTNRAGYKPLPAKRVMIPKALGSDKMRPLGIPAINDRVLQMLYGMSLEPIATKTADENSFGFMKGSGTLDAIFTLLKGLHNPLFKPEVIFDADIKGFFDNISHEWILKVIPMDKVILKAFLKAGFVFNSVKHETPQGVPQGSPISPIISNMVLDGLQAIVTRAGSFFKISKFRETLLMVRYADDFMIVGLTAKLEWLFTKGVILDVNKFLKARGLELSPEKSKQMTRENAVFDFLGYTFQWVKAKTTNNKFWLLTPSTKAFDQMIVNLKEFFIANVHTDNYAFLVKLNAKLNGWANYFKYGYSREMFRKIDRLIWKLSYIRAVKRYKGAAAKTIISKMFVKTPEGLIPMAKDANGKVVQVVKLSKVVAKPVYGPIRRGKYKGQSYP